MYAPGSDHLVLTHEAEERIRRINSERSKAYDKGIADGTIKPYVHVETRSGGAIRRQRRARAQRTT